MEQKISRKAAIYGLKEKMSNLIRCIPLFCLALLSSCHSTSIKEKELDPSLTLWYDKPAERWTEALPLGNGRLGVMVYGRGEKEIIQFNEETLWTGQPHDYTNEGAHKVLDELRQLLFNGKQAKATKLANEHFMSEPFGQLNYQPFGNILLNFPGHGNTKNFKRKLDLENAMATVTYEVEGVEFKREIFISNPDQALMVRLEASEKGNLNFTIGLDSPHSEYDIKVEEDVIILKGKVNDYPKKLQRPGAPYPRSALTFEARLKVVNEGGELVVDDGILKIIDGNSATIQLVAATSFVDFRDIGGNPTEQCKKDLKKLNDKSYQELRNRHIKDFQELFNRVELDLGESIVSNRPTNERLDSFTQDEDPNLVSLLYQYGRYLLISSSRKGTQPANLQGIWNDKLNPSWDSKYTININTEMNYWLAEITNLSELTDPLIRMVEDLAITGQNVAKEHYDLKGWVAHHNTDLWRGAAPINNANHGIWVTGGAWLSQHVWWHYQFTSDKDYLKNRAYPILEEASRFFAGFLVPEPDHPEWLVSGPSNSPENGGLVMAPTMDHQIIRNLFSNTIEAAEILGVDTGFTEMIREKRDSIAPNSIGRHGQLQEWLVDRDDPNNKHRHVSHLWGLHPGNEIHPLTTPNLAEACKITLKHRGDGGTGWSRAWKINFWARLLDGDHSFLLLKNLMVPSITQDVEMNDKGGLYHNLFDAHPPFQIDGNFGVTSGITEMMLQSHLRDKNGNYFQDILPAIPSKLPSGKVSGIMGRGAFEIGLEWKNGDLISVRVRSLKGNHLNLRYRGGLISQKTTKGEMLSFVSADFK